MGHQIDVKGVRFRLDGLTPAAHAYIEAKLRRILRRQRRARPFFSKIFKALLPSQYQRVDVERHLQARGRVLVVGCAAGIETMGLRATNAMVVGLDIDREALALAVELRRHAPPENALAHFMAASGARLPFPDRAFDAILSDNVVEHIPDGALQLHLAEARRVLKPGGFYFLTTPNALFEPVPDPGHVSLHTYAEWEALLRAAGFSSVETPHRRSGPFEDLEWKKRHERRSGLWGAGNRGLKMVTLRAAAP